MNKSQLIEELAEKTDHHVRVADKVVNIFFDNIKNALSDGDKVEIRGFGSFFLKEYDGYTGRNPKTGDKVNVPSKKLPVFRTGKDLKEKVKNSKAPLKKSET
ncbi:MAG: integration host factor subunit beta [SAR324 cluster bacterium]|nr:integration host factor subunit beta [SAR324 cluster bacterium]